MFSQPATIDTLFEPHMAIFKTIVMLRMRFFFALLYGQCFYFFTFVGQAKRKNHAS